MMLAGMRKRTTVYVRGALRWGGRGLCLEAAVLKLNANAITAISGTRRESLPTLSYKKTLPSYIHRLGSVYLRYLGEDLEYQKDNEVVILHYSLQQKLKLQLGEDLI